MPDESIVTPIGSPRGQETSALAKGPRSLRRDIDCLVFCVCALMALTVFGLTTYFFYGFAQTDQGFWTLASAFGLCFGVGALAYVPLIIVAIIAKRSLGARASRKNYAFALLLMLPWVCVSLVLTVWSALPLKYSFIAVLLSASLSLWALVRLRRHPRV